MIEVVEFDAGWAVAFRREAEALRGVLGEVVGAVHHIGSTSVPGLAAKPVIDILLEVRRVEELDAFAGAMEGLGYVVKGEFGIPGRRFYLKGEVERSHHVHAFEAGCADVVRHLAFRDYLMAHPEVAEEYAALKRKAAARFRFDNDGYCEAKEAFVVEYERLAVAWAGRL